MFNLCLQKLFWQKKKKKFRYVETVEVNDKSVSIIRRLINFKCVHAIDQGNLILYFLGLTRNHINFSGNLRKSPITVFQNRPRIVSE